MSHHTLYRLQKVFTAFHPLVVSLFIGTALSRIATSMTVPFFTIYLTAHTEASPLQIGVTVGAASIAGMIFGLAGGALSDRWGRRRLMMISLLMWSGVFLLFPFTQSFWGLLLLSALNGLCKAGFEPASAALISDLTPAGLRYRAYSYRYTAANIGVSVGPVLGALIGFSGGSSAFVLTGISYLLYLAVLLLLFRSYPFPESIQGTGNPAKSDQITLSLAWKAVLRDRRLLWFLAGGALMQFAYAQMPTLSPYVSEQFENGVFLFAWLMTTNAVTVTCCQLPVSAFLEKRSPLFAIALGNSLYALGGLGFILAGNSWTMISAMVVFSLGEVFSFPSGSILMDRIAPPRLKGAYMGAQQLRELGRFLGPVLGLPLLMRYGIGPVFFLVGLVCCFSTVCYFIGGRCKPIRDHSGGKIAL
ncbi:MFS transporter [Paenibacillus sp. GD4]|uniref:MDR family MFS transporter n=1 Tax=Paenibacillus sp. GD4 TaxID=3068890 RepID=UPI002796CD7D|nr:MFS transporter [Paenibacillus sp. GD4]MDQ1911002.1 MFS transporter [Paenibacillus sp. GD4]